ncbi:MAG: hypothetical protein SGJ00_07575 [bacterium]|nr:hypothetical protein [bacterium]
MPIQEYHITGKFKANYSSSKSHTNQGGFRLNTITNIFDPIVFSPASIEPYQTKHMVLGDDYFYIKELNDVIVSGGGQYFKTKLTNVYIREVHLAKRSELTGEINGIIYATLRKEITNKTGSESGSHTVSSEPNSIEPYVPISQLGKKDNNGFFGSAFLRAIYWLILLLTLLLLWSILPHKWMAILLTLALLVLGYFLLRFLGKIISLLICGLLLLFLITTLLGIIDQNHRTDPNPRPAPMPYPKPNPEEEDKSEEKTELTIDTTETEMKPLADSIFVLHFRHWNDYFNNEYSGILKISQKQYFVAKQKQQTLEIEMGSSDYDGFHDVYKSLYQYDEKGLPFILNMFDSIRLAKNLNAYAFSNMVVSCVQDIDYVLVIDIACEFFKANNPQYQNIPCLDGVKFGVQSPSGFMYNLQGDCDTRALLLFYVLSHFGYDACIMVSQSYSHAILGLNLPTTGFSLQANGRNYYTWETTAKGFMLGQLSPQCSNMNNWHIVITSK